MSNQPDGPFIAVQLIDIPEINLINGGIIPAICKKKGGRDGGECPFNFEEICPIRMREIGQPTIFLRPETIFQLLRISFQKVPRLSVISSSVTRKANCCYDHLGFPFKIKAAVIKQGGEMLVNTPPPPPPEDPPENLPSTKIDPLAGYKLWYMNGGEEDK